MIWFLSLMLSNMLRDDLIFAHYLIALKTAGIIKNLIYAIKIYMRTYRVSIWVYQLSSKIIKLSCQGLSKLLNLSYRAQHIQNLTEWEESHRVGGVLPTVSDFPEYISYVIYFPGHSICARYRTNGVTNSMTIMIVSYNDPVQQCSDTVASIA